MATSLRRPEVLERFDEGKILGPLNILRPLQATESIVPSVVVVLIHGTCATKAKWVEQGSALHQDLVAEISGKPLIFCFPWNGRNCVVQRELAASALRKELTASVERYPGVPHVLIGHSHGGNIALRAVAGMAHSESVKIVCLSTPLIYLIPRPSSDERRERYFYFLLMALGFVAYLLGIESKPSIVRWAYVLLVPVLLLLQDTALRRYSSWANTFCDSPSPKMNLSQQSVLFLRFLGDEASFALSVFQAIQYVLTSVMKLQAQIVARAVKVADVLFSGWTTFLICLVATLLGLIWLFLMTPTSGMLTAIGYPRLAHWLKDGPGIALPSFFALALMFLPLASMAILTLANALLDFLLLAVGIFPFGWKLALVSVWAEITVESALAGGWRLITLFPEKGDSTMRHSLGYEDLNARRQVVAFVTNSVSPDGLQSCM